MTLPKAQTELIADMLGRPGVSPSRVARLTGVSIEEVLAVLQAPTAARTTKYLNSVYGRDSLRPFIISVRHAYGFWPDSDYELIGKARVDYDAGFIEMCQGRDGDHIILYSFPREKRANRRPYFFKPAEE